MPYAIRYNPDNGKKSIFLHTASKRVRTFKTKKAAIKVKNIYDYKPKIRIVKR